MNNYFILHAGCIPVKGAKNCIICDLQRETYFPIPHTLYEILTRFSKKQIIDIKRYFDNTHDIEIDDYFKFLEDNEYGFYSKTTENFPSINLKNYYESSLITNAIIDFDKSSSHDFGSIINQLSDLMCNALEIRFFERVSMKVLREYLEETNNSTLRSIEISVPYSSDFKKECINELSTYPRLKNIIIHSSPYNELIETESIHYHYVSESITSENCCGVVSPWYFITETSAFIEAHHKNSCLNRKVCIDKFGNIKNCPSMSTSFGNIEFNTLQSVVGIESFQAVWDITKDQVDVCKDCEFRYICQDCRAYTKDKKHFSKPLKCNYDPYAAKWN